MIDGIKRVSTPGRRVYVGCDETFPRCATASGCVLSTSKGVMCDRDARAQPTWAAKSCVRSGSVAMSRIGKQPDFDSERR